MAQERLDHDHLVPEAAKSEDVLEYSPRRAAIARRAGKHPANQDLHLTFRQLRLRFSRLFSANRPGNLGQFQGLDALPTPERPAAAGKFIHRNGEKFYVRGVTYGTFGYPDGYPPPRVVGRDFAAMAAAGVNSVRTYTVPPRWFLDLADSHGLCVLVGVAWEQHVAFLADRNRAESIARKVRDGVRACAGHPAVLAYVIGNEIPASIVRWHGRRRVERFIERLYDAAKEADADALVTYANYPSTEYLHLPFLDVVAFNVYLERDDALDTYLVRLQNLAGDRPLVLTEVGLDSRRNGEEVQAAALEWQIRGAFRAGCAGAFVFSWTDEWQRGGVPVDDWDFGLVRRDRSPKPALDHVRRAFAEVPFPAGFEWPRVSVIVCSHDGAETIGECLAAVGELEYPSFETIVVDDGSTDQTAEIASRFGVRLIRTENRGLSSARNAGLAAASGDIVAFLDDDAWPDPHWLQYLAGTFLLSQHAGVGGPNVPPPARDTFEAALAEAPGGPVHVLLSDGEAEHIPGCNMAFRRAELIEAGGFDPKFRVAGDDVDVCWRLHARGQTLGFSPGAVVWHRRRGSIREYLRQQRGYGAAEALLERKWPERYNRGGHLKWSGHVYGGRARRAIGRSRWRVYYGTWGSGLFQSVYQRAPGTLSALPLMPEWYLLLAALLPLAAYGAVVDPLRVPVFDVGVPVFVLVLLAASAALFGSAVSAASSIVPVGSAGRPGLRFRALVTVLFLVQPAARLWGRITRGLTPWRLRGPRGLAVPWPQAFTVWSERWFSSAAWLSALEDHVRTASAAVHRGGDFDRWDLEARTGALASARVRMAVEEHGHGRQLLRFRVWPVWSRLFVVGAAVLGGWLIVEVLRGVTTWATIVGFAATIFVARSLQEASAAVRLFRERIELLSIARERAHATAVSAARTNGGVAAAATDESEDFDEALARIRPGQLVADRSATEEVR